MRSVAPTLDKMQGTGGSDQRDDRILFTLAAVLRVPLIYRNMCQYPSGHLKFSSHWTQSNDVLS